MLDAHRLSTAAAATATPPTDSALTTPHTAPHPQNTQSLVVMCGLFDTAARPLCIYSLWPLLLLLPHASRWCIAGHSPRSDMGTPGSRQEKSLGILTTKFVSRPFCSLALTRTTPKHRDVRRLHTHIPAAVLRVQRMSSTLAVQHTCAVICLAIETRKLDRRFEFVFTHGHTVHTRLHKTTPCPHRSVSIHGHTVSTPSSTWLP
jgi:hypothetical protein